MDDNGISIVSEIDRTLKRHTDNLLHTLEGVSARLSNLEIRTCDIENSVEDMKEHVGSYNSNRKLRQLENMLGKVQEGLRVLQEKQEIVEAFKHANFQGSKEDLRSENQNSIADTRSAQGKISAPGLFLQSLTNSVPQSVQQLPGLHCTVESQAPVQQSPSLVHPPPRLPQSQIPATPQPEPYYPTPCQPAEAIHQQYQFAPPPTTRQQYESVQQHSQPPQPSQQHPPVNPSLQRQPLSSHHSEESIYIPQQPQTYPPSVNQFSPIPQPVRFPHHSQEFYGAPSNMYSENIPFHHSLSQYNAPIRPPQGLSTDQCSGSSQRNLQTAQLLPRALPTANSNGSGSSTSGTGNESPIDGVVDMVVMMGFSRDQVKATVSELSENGKQVDFNAVLDKLMNQ